MTCSGVLVFESDDTTNMHEGVDSSFFRLESQDYEVREPDLADTDAGTSFRVQPTPPVPAYGAIPNVHNLPRYEQIIGQNRALLHNAGVLDLMSGEGYAALPRWTQVPPMSSAWIRGRVCTASAEWAFAKHAVPVSSYRFVVMEIMPALYDTDPEAFDVIIARGVLERIDLREFFPRLRYLRPKHVILDTVVTVGNGALVRYAWRDVRDLVPAELKHGPAIVATPNHELILLLCDCFGFACRLEDGSDFVPGEAGQGNGAGTQIRTYILDRISK